MILIYYFIVFSLSFVGMEFIAWFSHKYIMHGWLWNLHKDHHTGGKHTVETNDLFSLIFALPSFLSIFCGLMFQLYTLVAIGFGMTAYGIAYFCVHDVFIHQRIKLFRNIDSAYFRAVRRAHKLHHKHLEKENGESFGFLFVKKKYYEIDPKQNVEQIK